ncbi:T9SS type A sorting domain-containing protein [Flavobacterium orientale]|uniref:T9SS C-terminal target domain-containing protein n=1 Tax=Flavobacterium orientale TaxID=1756020 RepID=A0A916XYC4_9FLAO|nr:T9SS type A sorting domain-containing protein [Flavobacterium orientale]GGD19473.1 T9SS C-terminal target domain-containing protein [Flavobacterium orientale]
MRVAVCFVLFFLLPFYVNGQLYVKNNSFLYVDNQYVTVSGYLNLDTSGAVYLRNDGQLLQKGVASTNDGPGHLSVYQEGTVNNYQYNYWCSPVGNTSSVGNNPFGITFFQRPTTKTQSSPVATTTSNNGTTTNSNLTISSKWIYRFLSSEFYSQWLHTGAATTIETGQGFTMKGSSGSDATQPYAEIVPNNASGASQRYDFRGRPNSGTITIDVAANKFTLTGNPYPSAIDLNLFLTDTINTPFIDGTALFWEHDKTINSHVISNYRGGYGVYNGSTSVYTPATFYSYDLGGNQGNATSTPLNNYERRFSPIGQGFMIRGLQDGTVEMKNDHRVYRKENVADQSEFERNANATSTSNTIEDSESDFFGEIPNLAGIDYSQVSKKPAPHIKINTLLNNQAIRQYAICFLPNAIEGLDNADSKSPDGTNLPFDSYLYLNQEEYVHSTKPFAVTNVYPIGFKCNTEATFKIGVSEMNGVSGFLDVYLHDKVTDVYYDIKNSEQTIVLPAGTNNTRYEIAFLNATLDVPELLDSQLIGYSNLKDNLLVIDNPKNLELNTIDLYDLSGKKVLHFKNVGSNNRYEFDTSLLGDSIYILQITTKEFKNAYTQKIPIF